MTVIRKNRTGATTGRRTVAARREAAVLQKSELRYRRLFETAQDGILILDAETGLIVDVNPFLVKLLGISREAFLGKQLWELGFFKDIVANQAHFAELQEKGYIRYEDRPLETADGRRVAVEFVSNVYRENGVKVIQCNIRDITQHRSQEREIVRLNRLYATLSQINKATIRVKSREELFREVCRITTEFGRFKMVWVGRRDPDTQQVVPVAREGDAEGYLDKIKVYADDRPEGYGPVGTCIREDRPCVFNDFLNDQKALPWRESAVAHGLRAVAALPLYFRGQVWGAFTVYDKDADVFQDKEVALMAEAAMDISHTMENLEKEAKRQAVEAALGASELRYRRLFESAKDGILILDAETGMIVDVNPFLVQLLGISPEAFCGKKVWELGFFKDIVANEANFAELQAKGYVRYDNMPLETSDGRRIEMEFVSNVYLVDHQKVIQCNIRDITAHQRTAESHARLITAVEQAAECIVITDVTGVIQYVNPAFEQVTGYTRAEALGQTPRILKSGRQDAAFYRAMWETLLRGEVWTGHFSNKRKDGTLYEEEATISPIRDSQGKILSYVAVKRDVTREQQVEHQLRQSQKMEAVGRLAGGVAHDFNNILTAIIGYSAMLQPALPDSSTLQNYAREIEKAGFRAAQLTRQLLAFSRKQILQPKVLDLNTVIIDLEKMLLRLIGEDVEVTNVLAAGLKHIKADPGQIEQVIINLCVNARDAMPQGGKLRIATSNVTLDADYADIRAEVAPGDYVSLAITDDGCGMTAKVQAHLFEPFFTTKEQGKGTGLGLATVFGIINQSGGFINVYSEPGHGTAFKIYLPSSAEATEQQAATEADGHLPRGTETILVVEDEPSLRELATVILAEAGYQVLTAGNGVEGLAVAAQHTGSKIALLMTDVVMPQMGGRELADQLQAKQPGLKVLFISGYTADAIVRSGVLDSDIQFLQKPFTPGMLARKVREVLDR